MSLKPGIGAIAIAKLYTSGELSLRVRSVIKSIDAPVVLRKNGHLLPLGRYLRGKWREASGRTADTPKQELEKFREELCRLLKKDEVEKPSGFTKVKQQATYQHWRKNSQKALSLEARSKIYAGVKTL